MNPYIYRLRADTIYHEDVNSFIVYGMDAMCVSDKTLTPFPDMFLDRLEAERFIHLCNAENLSLLHIADVIEYYLP